MLEKRSIWTVFAPALRKACSRRVRRRSKQLSIQSSFNMIGRTTSLTTTPNKTDVVSAKNTHTFFAKNAMCIYIQKSASKSSTHRNDLLLWFFRCYTVYWGSWLNFLSDFSWKLVTHYITIHTGNFDFCEHFFPMFLIRNILDYTLKQIQIFKKTMTVITISYRCLLTRKIF